MINADGGNRTPERFRAPALYVIKKTLEAGVLPARLHLLNCEIIKLLLILKWNRYKFLSILRLRETSYFDTGT